MHATRHILLAAFLLPALAFPSWAEDYALRVGVAEVDITPPVGFPMAGYYYERLAEGTLDPLKARAVVFRSPGGDAAWVVCDLIGISIDHSRAVRKSASEKTGIPVDRIVISATHSHTAPDYTKELYRHLGQQSVEPLRAGYIEKLIQGPVEAIVQAHARAEPAVLACGSATQETPVSFNRRFVMRDGSVRTWMNFNNPDVVRAAGPIDSEIGLISVRAPEGQHRAVLSSFALHLDTVSGTKWSADYPHFIETSLRESLGPDVISLFGTGCCGDINHVNPREAARNTAQVIGTSLGQTAGRKLDSLPRIAGTELIVKSARVDLPLQEVNREDVTRAVGVLATAAKREKVDFFDHVTAYKHVMLDQWRNRPAFVNAEEHITWGLSRSLTGIGETLPVDVTVFRIGSDAALVFLPGEVFVELGLAIKQASPFRTTLVVELSNAVETIYVPHRAAYASGSYEVTNSTVKPGSGEVLVETAVRLLREAASMK